MARIRTIKPEFWTHEDLSALPEATHMLAAALLNHADDEGYFNANPGLVKAACCPLREPSVSVHDSLNLLLSAGFIFLFSGTDKKRYGRIVKFDEHQRVNRPTPSKIKHLQDLSADSVSPHGAITDTSPPERNREQGKEQGTGNREESSLRSDLSENEFRTNAAEPLRLESQKPADLTAKRAEREQRLAAVTDDAIAAYNAALAKPRHLLAKVTSVGRENRRRQVHRVVKLAQQICTEQFGGPTVTPEFWAAYFGFCADDPFLSGEGPYTGTHANWRPDFDFLTTPKTMLKVYDRSDSDEVSDAARA